MTDPNDPNLEPTQQIPQYTPPGDGGGPGGVDGGPSGPSGPDGGEGSGFWSSLPPWAVAAAGGVAVLLIVLLVVVLGGGDDDGDDVATDTTPTVVATETPTETPTESPTEAPTETPEATPTPQATPTPEPTAEPEPTATAEPAPVDPEQYATAVWPWFDSDVRYSDPVEAARGFATDFVGFDGPTVGEFMQGDSRSGEVEITTFDGGPVTTVFVRQLGEDDTWWVLGSATENIEVTSPEALAEITSPLEVTGSALAFEGTVNVDIRADGQDDPIYEGFVTGGGAEVTPFDDTLEWDSPGDGSGAVIFKTLSAEDGSVMQAAVVRVTFG